MKRERLLLPALGIIIGVALPTAPAGADCVSDCQASTYCDSDMNASGECGRRLNDCYLSQCNRPRVSYGAIVYGARSQAFGFSFGLANAGAAERRALSNCKKHGDDCEIVASFENTCAAVAGGNNARYATGEADTRQQAERAAMAGCSRAGGDDCEAQVWTCAQP